MSIKKILLLAGMALAAVAFAAPATAGAVVQLTGVNVGNGVTATGIDVTTTTSNGTLECAVVTLHYTLAVNGNSHVELSPKPNQPAGPDKHNGTTAECFLNTGAIKLAATIATAGTSTVTFNTWGTAATPTATFTSVIPSIGLTCEFHGTVPIQATQGTDIAHIETKEPPEAAHLTGTGANCPTTGRMHGTFTFEKSNGDPISAHLVTTP